VICLPFKYVIKWKRKHPESVVVEARNAYRPHRKGARRKAFVLGRASGSRLLTIRHTLEDALKRFPHKKQGGTTLIFLNRNDEEAYRIGLATALLGKATDNREMQRGVSYILNATPEEVWFWSSKWLDEDLGEKALKALTVLSGAA
jgi:hypothetical protein